MSDRAGVVVDAGVWIDFLRADPTSPALRELVEEGRAILIAPVAVEVLQGVRGARDLPRIRRALRSAHWLDLHLDDLLNAAGLRSELRDGPLTPRKNRHATPSMTDAAVVAAACRRELWVWTTDPIDLARVASAGGLGLRLFGRPRG